MTASDRQDKGARFLLMVASFIIVIAGLKAASKLILPFLVALFLTMITLPLLNWLQSRRIPSPIAVLVTVVVALGVFVLVVAVIAESLQQFTAAAPQYQVRLKALTGELLGWLRGLGIPVAEAIEIDLITPANALDLVAGTVRGVAAVVTSILLVLIITVFSLFEAAGFPAKVQAAFGDLEGSARFEKIRLEVQRYLGVKTGISFATGISIGVGTAMVGLDFAALWGVLAFLLNYIPNLGSIIAAVLPVMLALVQLGPGPALAVAAIFIVVNVSLGSLLEPYIMGRRLGLSTLVVVLSLVFWGWVWGPVGMLLSVPLTMITKILLENTEDLRWIAVLLGAGPPRASGPPVEPPGR